MSQKMWGDKETQFFYQLGPDQILDAIDNLGLETTGRTMVMNSMENRVYEIEIYSNSDNISEHSVIAKFYRPGRWSKEQILDEHKFLQELDEEEIPVIAPMSFNGETLFLDENSGLYYCVFPKKGGRAPDEMNIDDLEILGRTLARLHNIGASKKAEHRLEITPQNYGLKNLEYLLDKKVIPPHLEQSYKSLVEKICAISSPLFKKDKFIRLHGDCHIGNIIRRDETALHLIDFDDMVMGPEVQDIWLAIPGIDNEARQDREILLEAYETMRPFAREQLKLIEPLRTLRFIHFSTWISKRWEDPAFKLHFPQFAEHHYWDIQIQDLTNQLRIIEQSLAETPYY
ncbi:serine/threonine protein kinase [Halobacteriovorax sp. HLS]|uniref:serine/threonine protein kinase n=1 Tax=Halobacteriovorax sp. HLS TaxID=2234000 RepID=UPI000FD77612|nr:serine/threonine protein kinase [Halobacteriovorax sp. HLS]